MIPPIVIRIIGKDAFSTKFKSITKEVGQFGKSMQGVGRNMSLYLTAPMALFGASVLNTAGEFEYGMNRVRAITGATGAEFSMLENKALELGESTVHTANQVTQGMQLMAQSGIGVEKTYKGIEAVLHNASANMIDMGESANITVGLMGAFKMPIEELTDITDILTKTTISSMTGFTDLAEAFLYAAPTAGAMNKSLVETSSVLAIMANGMLRGSMAGTSLRGIMAKLTAPTPQAVGIMQKLGITYDDILDKKGDLKSFVDVVKAFEGTSITAGQVLQIFGLRAGPGFQIMLNAGSEALADMNERLEDFQGTAKEIAEIQLMGFKGQMWKLTSAFQGFKIAIAKSGILIWGMKVGKFLTEFFRKMAKFHPALLKWVFAFGMIVAIAGPLIFILGTLIAMLPFLIIGFKLLAGALLGIIWPIVGLLAFLYLGYKIYTQWDSIAKKFDEVKGHFKELIDDILYAFRLLDRTGQALSEFRFGDAWEAFSGLAPVLGRVPSGEHYAREQSFDASKYVFGRGFGGVIRVDVKAPKGTDVSAEGEGGIALDVNQGKTFGDEWD